MFKTTKFCIKCSQPAGHKCSRCGDTYCSAFCQDLHWNEHRYFCYPKPALIPLELEFERNESEFHMQDNQLNAMRNPFKAGNKHVAYRSISNNGDFESDYEEDLIPMISRPQENNFVCAPRSNQEKLHAIARQLSNGNCNTDQVSLIDFGPFESVNDDLKTKKTDIITKASPKETAPENTAANTVNSKDVSKKLEEPNMVDDNPDTSNKTSQSNSAEECQAFEPETNTNRNFREIPDNSFLNPLKKYKPKYFDDDLFLIPLEDQKDIRVEVLDFSNLDNKIVAAVPVNPVTKMLYSKLTKTVNQVARKYPKLRELPKQKELLLAKYNENYLRAVCLKAESEDQIHVVFLDYGNSKITKMSKCRKFPQELTFAYTTHICFMKDLESDEIDDLNQAFDNGNRFLKLRILNVSPDIATVALIKRYDGSYLTKNN